MSDPSLITSVDQLPEADRYLWGWDLSLSGWGPFAPPDDPDRMESFLNEPDYWKYPSRCLAPVVFPLQAGDDETLLKFNCDVCDVRRDTEYGGVQPYGRGKTTPTEEELQELKRDLDPYKHSIVAGFVAMVYLDKHKATGMHQILHWLLETRKVPHVIVRSRDTRWYTEPGLGWTFYDAQEQPFRYCHPREQPKRGDFALEKDDIVREQRSTYRGRRRRYKVTLVEE